MVATPEVNRYLPFSHWPNIDSLTSFLGMRNLETWVVVPIVDSVERGEPPLTAGIVALISDHPNLATEMGIILLPEWHRTFVSTHAVGVLLRHCFEPIDQGGRALRRVEWRTSVRNEGSARLAKRMGFQQEGILRWLLVLPAGKIGEHRTGKEEELPGRHTIILSVCWDDWESEAFQQEFQRQMLRST